MLLLSEEQVLRLLQPFELIPEIRKSFIDKALGVAGIFPFVREPLRGGNALFGVKSAVNYDLGVVGLKAGGYWNDNDARGLDRHQSSILLLDLATGLPRALIAGNALTALRTAAASAVAADLLARTQCTRLGIIGTGRQALFQLDAIIVVRPIAEVSAWSPNADHVAAFGAEVARRGLEFHACASAGEVGRQSDILVTVTPSRSPLLDAGDILPGTHISAMGSDTAGKRELAASLMRAGSLYTDDIRQARQIGECQHVHMAVADLGDAMQQGLEGRSSDDQITIFDGTGIAVQDLAAAALACARAQAAGEGTIVGEGAHDA